MCWLSKAFDLKVYFLGWVHIKTNDEPSVASNETDQWGEIKEFMGKILNCATYIHGRWDVYRKTLTERKLISPSDQLTRSILQNGCVWNLKMSNFSSPLWPNKDREAPAYISGTPQKTSQTLSIFVNMRWISCQQQISECDLHSRTEDK